MSEIIEKSKVCAGTNCPNEGVHQLTVIYLNRVGWFCNNCKNELIKENLVFENKRSGALTAPEPAALEPQENQSYDPIK